jgi:hypothetical protein
MRKNLLGSLVLVSVICAPARAEVAGGDTGAASAESATVTVVIPPVQAGIDASREGAVGLWTLGSASGGLMIKLPRQMIAGESAELDLLRADGNVFGVKLPQGSGLTLTRGTSSERNGLKRQSYVLSNIAAEGGGQIAVVIVGI